MQPWEDTFRWLAATKNRAAVEVLLCALQSPRAEFARAALLALMKRPEAEGHHAILTRFDFSAKEWRDCFAVLPGPFQESLRNFLIHGPVELRRQVCQFLVATEQFDFVPLLAHLLENKELQPRDVIAATLQELCRKLGLASAAASAFHDPARLTRVTEQVRRSLLLATDRFPKHHSREVLDSLILLATGNSRLLLEILRSPIHPARKVVIDILLRDNSPHTLNLLCDFMQQPDVPEEVLGVIAQRSDLPFVRHFLRSLGGQLSAVVRRHLKQLPRLAFLEHLDTLLPALDEFEQSLVPTVAVHSAMPRPEALKLVGRLLMAGPPAARRAAAEALDDFNGAEANNLALKALSDPDPLVQAAILPQIRRRGVIGALPRVIKLLESPHPAVRKAARKSLREFSFARFLQAWDLLPLEVRKETGMLVKRVDHRTVMLLRAELMSPFRMRRLRALAIAQELELVPRLESSIVALLGDEDSSVRAEAAAVLADSESVASYQALMDALNDRNAVVRSIAARSLELRRQRHEADADRKSEADREAPTAQREDLPRPASGSIPIVPATPGVIPPARAPEPQP